MFLFVGFYCSEPKDFPKIKKCSSKKLNPHVDEINVYVHNDFNEPFEKRRKFKCNGEICEMYRVSQKNVPTFKTSLQQEFFTDLND